MKIFADTACKEEIQDLAGFGILDGVTTNPSLVAKTGLDFKSILKDIAQIVNGPVSAEVVSNEYSEMLRQAEILADISSNIVIKLPITWDGIKACKALTKNGIKTNMTLCFNVNQALLVAKAGASFVSPFIGRLDDLSLDGMELIRDIRTVYDNYNFKTEILAASVRTVYHVSEAAIAGADCATLPPDIIKKMIDHPLSEIGLNKFMSDWNKNKSSQSSF